MTCKTTLHFDIALLVCDTSVSNYEKPVQGFSMLQEKKKLFYFILCCSFENHAF